MKLYTDISTVIKYGPCYSDKQIFYAMKELAIDSDDDVFYLADALEIIGINDCMWLFCTQRYTNYCAFLADLIDLLIAQLERNNFKSFIPTKTKVATNNIRFFDHAKLIKQAYKKLSPIQETPIKEITHSITKIIRVASNYQELYVGSNTEQILFESKIFNYISKKEFIAAAEDLFINHFSS